MPIYEYRCSACGHDVEALQKFSDAPLLTCPSCHKDALVKQLSAAGFQLKGSGWYATDFKGGSKPAPTKPDGAAAEGGGATEGAAKSTGKEESGSAAKSETKSEKSETKSDSPATTTKSGATPATT